MNISVLIASVGRPETLHETVRGLREQQLRPREILLGTPGRAHVLDRTLREPGVRWMETPLGLPAQRNRCLEEVSPEAELLLFLDDDMELHPGYLRSMEALFRARPELVAASGVLLHDGGISTAISRDAARALCQGIASAGQAEKQAAPRRFAYGCNMAYRASAINGFRFDENLPLYAWLEDSDFSYTATRGRSGAVTNLEAFGVHLGSRGGRIAGRRLGFSQIVNPFYLWRKSRVFSLPFLAVHYWALCLTGNLLGLVRGERAEDRKGRLIGNMHGFAHLLRGRACPLEALRFAQADGLSVEPGGRGLETMHEINGETERLLRSAAEGSRR